MAAGARRASAVRTLLIFMLLGPPIGYAVFLVWIAGEYWLRHGRLMPDMASFLLVFPFSYLLGIIPALVVGAIVAVMLRLLRQGGGSNGSLSRRRASLWV